MCIIRTAYVTLSCCDNMLLHNDVERGDDLLFTPNYIKITKDKQIHEINMKKAQIEKDCIAFLA